MSTTKSAATQRVARQVDTILASLEEAFDGRAATAPSPGAALAEMMSPSSPGVSTAALPTNLPVASSTSPFSLAGGGGLFSSSKQIGAQPKAAALEAPAPAPTITLAELEAQLATSAPTAPNLCRPYDVGDYQLRLRTFCACAKWFDKPPEVCPPQCARFGWTLEGQELLMCPVCSARLKAPAALSTDADALRVMAEQLTSSHTELCPWRGNASPATIGALLLPGQHGAPPSLLQGAVLGREALRKRSASLLALDSLPLLADVSSEWEACSAECGFGSANEWCEAVLSLAGHSRHASALSAAERERRWVAVALALLGWQRGAAPATIECVEDARTIGLWRYGKLRSAGDGTPAAATAEAASKTAPALSSPSITPGKRGRPEGDEELPSLDVLAEHRSWSPWLNMTAGDTVPAWMRVTALLIPPTAPGRKTSAAPTTTASASAAIGQLLASF